VLYAKDYCWFGATTETAVQLNRKLSLFGGPKQKVQQQMRSTRDQPDGAQERGRSKKGKMLFTSTGKSTHELPINLVPGGAFYYHNLHAWPHASQRA
jgi:hypothetical protein